MAELRPQPFEQLLHRVLVEPARQGSLFDLPLRKAFRPRAGLDLSVEVHGHRAQTPVGPAAGPHAQLAQNIVLSWLGGSRVIELKTVQVLDQLTIPRPCIDAQTVGFNVEWSQELRLAESLEEYVAGWMLLRILRHLDPIGLGPEAAAAAEPVLELSVGYDLAGLASPAMRDYLMQVQHADAIIDRLRARIPERHRELRDLDYRGDLVHCVTLSTFHGCPPGEIEAIARYLLDEIGVDVIVKLNPTLLGYEEVSYLLHDRMGYHDLRPRRAAFDGDLGWEEALALGRRLQAAAARRGRRFGVKMTNTLVVENHKRHFAAEEMYLSGPPLHVLAMHCVERWRAAFGASVPLSFSGGIDQHNFADAVACDLVPVTTCTDLLRPGGYGRLPRYLANLEEAMDDAGARDRGELILRRFEQGAEAVRDVFAEVRERDERLGMLGAVDPHARAAAEALLADAEATLLEAVKGRERTLEDALAGFAARAAAGDAPEAARALVADLAADWCERIIAAAGVLNSHQVTARVTGDPRYGAGKNGKPPRKVGSLLVLLDCLSCDKCVPVCPNDAMFAVPTPPEELPYDDVVLGADGRIERVAAAGRWAVAKPEQWASYADACNECGNCDVFCPEDGGPFVQKARFFGSAESMAASPALDGFLVRAHQGELRVAARIAGRSYRVRVPAKGPALVDDGRIEARFDPATGALLDARPLDAPPPDAPPPADGAAAPRHALSGAVFLAVRALVRGVLDPARVNAVSAAVPDASWPSPPPSAGGAA